MKAAFIINSVHKKRFTFESDIQSQLSKKGITEIKFEYTKHSGHAIDLAKNLADNNFNYIVAVGGDGTINEVANGILLSENVTDVSLGICSIGTANDLCRTLNLKADWQEVVQLIEHNSNKTIDVGLVEFFNYKAEAKSRYFINVADLGIGGYVVDKVAKSKKTFGPKFTFVKSIFGALLTYEQSEIECKSPDFEWKGKLMSLAISNGRFFGSGLEIAPHAKIDDGTFDITIMSDIKKLDYIKHVGKVKKGEKLDHPKVFYHKTNKLEINPINLSCAVDLDGEFLGFAPIKVSLQPLALKVLSL